MEMSSFIKSRIPKCFYNMLTGQLVGRNHSLWPAHLWMVFSSKYFYFLPFFVPKKKKPTIFSTLTKTLNISFAFVSPKVDKIIIAPSQSTEIYPNVTNQSFLIIVS